MFEHVRLEQRVSELVAESAKLRRKAAGWTAACAAAVTATLLWAWASASTAGEAAALAALLAAGAVSATGVSSYWGWRRVRSMDGRIVGLLAGFAERAIEARLESRARQERDAGARAGARTGGPRGAGDRRPGEAPDGRQDLR